MAKKRQPVAVTTTVGDAINTAYSIIEELGSEMHDEAADILENISEPDVPDSASDLAVKFKRMPLKRNASRRDRMNNGLAYAYQAVYTLDIRIAELQEQIDELDTLRDEVQAMIDEAEFVEFHGIFG